MDPLLGGGSLLADIFQAIAERGRSLINRPRNDARIQNIELPELFEMLLAGRGEASGLALAQEILGRWQAADKAGRLAFLSALTARFGPDDVRLDSAIDQYLQDKSPASAATLHAAAEPRRQELIRRINMVPGAMQVLVDIRAEILSNLAAHPELAQVDADFVHLLSSWFNRGFLVLRRIDWSTSATILEKIIKYESVHAIDSWDDLRRRLVPGDRRCFAFFHPRLADEPLIFVEVALMRETPGTIDEVLAEHKERVRPKDVTTAVFYSISNTQIGLRGISFGNFLLKQVIEELRNELPGITDYVTLSPVSRFASWLAKPENTAALLEPGERDNILNLLEREGWADDRAAAASLQRALLPLAAHYFVDGRDANGSPVDPVARFHLSNGARLERINFLGDRSPKAMAAAHGLMVNYLYKLDDLEKNHELFASKSEVAISRAVRRLLGETTNTSRFPRSGKAKAPVALPEDIRQ